MLQLQYFQVAFIKCHTITTYLSHGMCIEACEVSTHITEDDTVAQRIGMMCPGSHS